MSYNIGLDQLANRVIPKFLRKPRQVSWINSLLFPLQFLNDELDRFANEKKIEANLSSQTLLLEWYLNNKYGYLFSSESNQKISIKHSYEVGLASYDAIEWGNVDPDFGVGTGVVSYNSSEPHIFGTIGFQYLPTALYVQYTMRAFAGELAINSGDSVTLSNDFTLGDGDTIEMTISLNSQGSSTLEILNNSINNSYFTIISSSGIGVPDFFRLRTSSGTIYNLNLPINTLSINTFYKIKVYRHSPTELWAYVNNTYYGTISINSGDTFNFNHINHSPYEGGFKISKLDLNGAIVDFNETDNNPEIYSNNEAFSNASPTYFDWENFGALPEDFVIILPTVLYGNDRVVADIKKIVDQYIIDTKKYTVEYIA